MLVLSRKENEEVLVSRDVSIKVVGIFGNKVRLAIAAPGSVSIWRAELDLSDASERDSCCKSSTRPAALCQ
jgi:carbon storage regulator CsrA